MNGLTRVDYPDGNYVSYSYDNSCRLTSVETPFGTTSYEYDPLDRLTRVVDRNGYATTYEYDANGYTATYDYDLLNRLICQKAVDIDGKIVVQYVYNLGTAGERKTVAESNTGMSIAQVINLVSIVFSMFNPTCFTGDT